MKGATGGGHRLTIINSLEVRERTDITYESAEELVSAKPKPKLSDIDCVIMQGDRVIALIECRAGKTGPQDVVKLYGLVKLLDAEFGVFIISHTDAFKTDQEFGCIKILPDVIDRLDFLDIFRDDLDRKLATII